MAVIRWSPLVSNETNDSRDAPVGEYSFAAATYVFMVSGILVWTAALRVSPVLAIYATALLFGWSEGNGLCGTSHVCCLTPLRVLDPSGNLWLRSVSAYTLAGIPTA